MPPRAWSAERERQCEHIEEGLEQRGRDEEAAEAIAARTVDNERVRVGGSRRRRRSTMTKVELAKAVGR